MLLGQIFQSIEAWKKLAGINMKPKLAYKVLKYTKKVSAECEIAEKQRVALIREITGTKEGEEAKIEPNSPEIQEYVRRFNEIMLLESSLSRLDLDFSDVINAVDEKDETLSVSDLALLEVFFSDYEEPVEEYDENLSELGPDGFGNEDGTPKTELNDA